MRNSATIVANPRKTKTAIFAEELLVEVGGLFKVLLGVGFALGVEIAAGAL